MNPLLMRIGLSLGIAILALAGQAVAIDNPLDDIIVCVWEGPNGECG